MSVNCIFSIICPTLNEEKYIGGIIENFLKNCPSPSELIIADAGSQDRTCGIVKTYSDKFPQIKLIHNPQRFVSYAFNKAFSVASGQYLGLLGAHAIYPANYFSAALEALESGACDVVGGPLKQTGTGHMGRAIAYCMSTKMGVGNTAFRTSKKRQYVDSVAFAIYKKNIFDQIGLLDTALIRNQDDELHYRINAHGFKILMIPEMECEYQVRDTIPKLFRQYFEYGLYKPLVIKKVRSGVQLRHLVPAFFVLYLMSLPIALFFIPWIVPLISYVLIVIYFSLFNANAFPVKTRSLLVYPVLHISYGLGFLRGILLAS